MVTFNCEVCNETVPKKKTEQHYYRCPDAYYTCIDCSTTFDDGVSYKKHIQCISEDEKYQKALYKGKKNQNNKQQQQPQHQQQQQQQQLKEKTPETKTQKSKKVEAKKNGKVTLKKGENLYKIMKSIKNKDTKKDLLKRLIVNDDGYLVLKD